MSRRRTVVGIVLLLAVAVVGGAVALVLANRGPGPDEVAEEFLTAQWTGDWTTECELATEDWQHVLFEGHPFADCDAFADSAAKANADNPFLDYVDDTDVDVSVQVRSDEDDVARVEYVVEFRYHGEDRTGFDALWQGGSAADRGTLQLARVDGDWRVAAVDDV